MKWVPDLRRIVTLIRLWVMRGNERVQDGMFSHVSLEQRVPADHPLREVRKLTDVVLGALSGELDALYAEGGRRHGITRIGGVIADDNGFSLRERSAADTFRAGIRRCSAGRRRSAREPERSCCLGRACRSRPSRIRAGARRQDRRRSAVVRRDCELCRRRSLSPQPSR